MHSIRNERKKPGKIELEREHDTLRRNDER